MNSPEFPPPALPGQRSLFLLGPYKALPGPAALRRKEWALLAYLVATGRPHQRYTLARLFCPEAAAPDAALRVLLSRIRRQLAAELILTEGDTVRVNRPAAWVDYLEFVTVLDGEMARQSLEQLEAAVNLYRGEFLQGLSLADSPEFEMWLLGQRAQAAQFYERGLAEISARLIGRGNYEAAVRPVQQLLQSNPLLEEAHAQLIYLYTQLGRREAALAQFELCRELLWRELAVEPAPELKALYAAALAGHPAAPFQETAAARETATPPQAATFVGRAAELEQLQAAWQAAAQGQGTVLLVTAGAGGGKSRLLEEFGRQLPAGAFLAGRCYESTTTLPYHPWIDLLEVRLTALGDADLAQLLPFVQDHLARLVPGLAQRLGRRAPQPPPTGLDELEHLFAAVAEFLFPPAGRAASPTLIFIDDLQWADDTSLRLFHHAARRAPLARLLLVGACRAEEVEDTPGLPALLADLRRLSAHFLALPPLPPAAVSALAGQLWPRLPAGYRSHVTAMLVQATGGNPLFVTELLRELARSRQLPAELPVPATIRDLIRRRLDQLPHRSRQVIEALAILHRPATWLDLQKMSGRSEDEVAQAIDWGLRRGLLLAQPGSRPARYDFHHDLVGEAVREQVSQARRELLHRRVARALEQSGAEAALLAYHWARAGDPAQEATYAAQAGEQAAAIYAHDEAIRYFQRALELLPQGKRRLEVVTSLGDLYLLVGRWPEAETLYRQAIAAAHTVPLRPLQARAKASLARLLELKGLYAEAIRLLEQARHDSAGDRQALARYTGDLGRVYWRQGNDEQALAHCNQALALSRHLHDPAAIASWLNTLGLIHWRQEKYQQALAHFEEACQIYRAAGDKVGVATCLGNIGNIHKDQEDYDQALSCYQAALDSDQETGNRVGMARHLGNMGVVYYNLAAYDQAMRCYQRALEIDRELGHQEGIARHLGNIGNIYWQQGRYHQTLLYYQQALQIDDQAGNQRGVALHVGNIGVIYSRCGAYDWAAACLAQALALDYRLGNKLGVARHLGNLADLYRRQGRHDLALAYCDRAITLLTHLNNQFHLSWHWLARAKILAARHEYAAALAANEMGRQAAATVQRQDTLFATQLLSIYLQAAANQLDSAAAGQKLLALLDKWPAEDQQAAIHYTRWQLEPDNAAARRQTAALYQKLATTTPDATYRRRYQELTGRTLPEPPPLPPLPPTVTSQPPDLEALLAQVDTLITTLT